MLWTLLVIVIVLWALGILGGIGNVIHVLLLVALVILIFQLLSGRLATADGFSKTGAHFKIVARPIVKVTGVWTRYGYESSPVACEINESDYIALPDLHPHSLNSAGRSWEEIIKNSGRPNAYRIYAPLKGFEKTGPWYFLRQVSFRDAKRARFTVAVVYNDSDLCPLFAPDGYVTFPEPARDQTHWMMYGAKGSPIGIFPVTRPAQ